MNQQQSIPTYHKMDRLFYNSILLTKNSYYKKVAFNIFKSLFLILFLILQYKVFLPSNQIITKFAYFCLLVSFLYAIINLIFVCTCYSNKLSNNLTFLKISVIVQHYAFQQPITNHSDLNDITKCVSRTLYNQTTGIQIDDPALTSQIKIKYQTINSHVIQSQILQRKMLFTILDTFFRILSFIIIAYGIFILASSNTNVPTIIMIIIYLLLEAVNVWFAIFIILVIIFFPVICCGVCCFLCFRGTNSLISRQSLDIPASQLATAQIIQNAQGSCTICLQNFNLNDKIIVLPCSNKHVFHQNCILSWLRVSNSCPNCRTALPSKI